MNWKLEHKKGDMIGSNVLDPMYHNDTTYSRPGFLGGSPHIVNNAHEIRECHHISGSGPINGERKWPHITLDISFPTRYEYLAEKLSKELRDFVDKFLQENDLETGDKNKHAGDNYERQ